MASTMKQKTLSLASYTISWITASNHGLDTALEVLDEIHYTPREFHQNEMDRNDYSWGRIGDHNIVIVPTSDTRPCLVDEASAGLCLSVPHIRISLLICHGVRALGKSDISLGDIVISIPDNTTSGVIAYDMYSKEIKIDTRTGSRESGSPVSVLRNAITALQADLKGRDSTGSRTSSAGENLSHQSVFSPRPSPSVHYGTIISSRSLDEEPSYLGYVSKEVEKYNTHPLCVEPGYASTLMDRMPCVVICTIFDYTEWLADDIVRWSVKYSTAAAAAAAARKALRFIDAGEVQKIIAIGDSREHSSALQAAPTRAQTFVAEADAAGKEIHLHSPIVTASLDGDAKALKHLIEQGVDVDTHRSNDINALHAASREGHTEIVKLLLQYDADVDAGEMSKGTALYAASAEGQTEIVKLLLEHGADVNQMYGPFTNALCTASAEGYAEIVKILLLYGANADSLGGFYGNALYAASARGHTEIVKLLLEFHANVNISGGPNGNALYLASVYGNTEAVKVLLEHGIDANAQGGYYGNALQAASAGGFTEIVKLLLEYNANVDVQGGHYGNALQAASTNGYAEIEKLLLGRRDNAGARWQPDRTGKRKALVFHNEEARSCPRGTKQRVMVSQRDSSHAKRGNVSDADPKSFWNDISASDNACAIPESNFHRDTSWRYREFSTKQYIDRSVYYFEAISAYVQGLWRLNLPLEFHLVWELPQFVQQELGGDWDVSDLLTITGSQNRGYATTCSSYVKEIWGSLGTDVLEKVTCTRSSSVPQSTLLKMPLPGQIGADHTDKVEVYAKDLSTAISVVQILAWLTAVFRIPRMGQPQVSELDVQNLNGELRIGLGRLSTANADAETNCWHGLVPGTSIATGFPILMRHTTGLAMSLDTMLDITDAIHCMDLEKMHHSVGLDAGEGPSEHFRDAWIYEDAGYSPFSHGVFYKGAGSILYPIRKEIGSELYISWHYEECCSTAMPPPNWMQVSHEDILQATQVLGFTPQAQIHLGTEDRIQQYSRMRSTSADEEPDRINFGVDSVNAQLGRPPAQIGLVVRIRYTRSQRAIVNSEQRNYVEILKVTEKQPVILYDHGSDKVAWLVSQLSVILDLVHFRIYQEGWQNKPEFAQLCTDGGSAAANVLRQQENSDLALYPLVEDGSQYKIRHLVKDIYCAMSQRQTKDAISNASEPLPIKFRHERLYGWDLLELADPPDCCFRKKVALHKTTSTVITDHPSWFPLCKRLPVYFCDNLGQIITSAGPICCRRVWPSGKLLVASVRTLRYLYRERDECSDIHLVPNLVWEVPMSTPALCKHQNCPANYNEQKARRVFEDSVQTLLENHKCNVVTKCTSFCKDGAVVFGPNGGLLSKINDLADKYTKFS